MDSVHQKNLLLVSKKQGNRPLRSVLNDLSEHGIKLHLSGHDSMSYCTKKNKFLCSTWHSSKGMESPTTFVIIGNESKNNPMYVALTRSMEKLVIILDAKNPNKNICRVCRLLGDEVDMDVETRRVVANANLSEETIDSSFENNVTSSEVRCRSIDNWRPKRHVQQFFHVMERKIENQDLSLIVTLS